jgi:hypothetical protein
MRPHSVADGMLPVDQVVARTITVQNLVNDG